MLLTRALLKKRPPHHLSPRTVRTVEHTPRFTCNRHPYFCASTVATLLRTLIVGPSASPEVSVASTLDSAPLPDDLRHQLALFAATLDAVPVTVENEGPLNKDAIQQMACSISNTAVERLEKSLLGGVLPSSAHAIVRDMWTAALCDVYSQALVSERELHVGRRKTGAEEPRYEAGLRVLQVLSEYASTHRLGSALLSNNASDDDTGSWPHRRALWERLVNQYTLAFPDRSHLHELENLPQEIVIGEILAECCEHIRHKGMTKNSTDAPFALECIVDVGGGNGLLAASVSERLGCRSVVVDPYYPPHSIDCCPSPWTNAPNRQRAARQRKQVLSRMKSFFKDIEWRRDIDADPHNSAVIAKHLCGSGIDELLQCMAAQGVLPRILVLAPCCYSKITINTYANKQYLRETLGIESQNGFNRLGRLTDWSMSRTQHAKEVAIERRTKQRARRASRESERERELSFPYKRVGSYRSVASTVPCMHAISQLIESVINYGRILWLRQHGYEASVVQYVPNHITPKCKCIVAFRNGSDCEKV